MQRLNTDIEMAMRQVGELKEQIEGQDSLLRDLGGGIRKIDDLDADEIENFTSRAIALVQQLELLLEQVAATTGPGRSEVGLRLTISQSELEREFDWLQELVDRLSVHPAVQQTGVSGVLANIKQRLIPS